MSRPTAADPSSWVIVGRIRRAHGMGGDVIVEPLTGAPEEIFETGRRLFGDPTRHAATGQAAAPVALHVAEASPFQQGLRVHFAEVPDRTSAESWRDRYLLLPPDETPPAREGEMHLRDFVGMRIERESGETIGEVEAYYELPQGILLEVARPGGAVLIPYRAEFVRFVDREKRVIVVELPVGLID